MDSNSTSQLESSSSCASSSSRRRQSTSGGRRKWDKLPLPEISLTVDVSQVPLPSGYTLKFFPTDLSLTFEGPSHLIYFTKGVEAYIHEYNLLGPSKTRTKLFLCTTYMRDGVCPNGVRCREVHPVTKTEVSSDGKVTASLASEITSNTIHARSDSKADHAVLPEGVVFRLSLPNTQQPIDEVKSEDVFVTKGAKEYFQLVMRKETPAIHMQHCAHFSKNGMCCFGPECQFVHVVGFAFHESPEISTKPTNGSTTPSTPNNKRQNRKAKETPLSMLDDALLPVNDSSFSGGITTNGNNCVFFPPGSQVVQPQMVPPTILPGNNNPQQQFVFFLPPPPPPSFSSNHHPLNHHPQVFLLPSMTAPDQNMYVVQPSLTAPMYSTQVPQHSSLFLMPPPTNTTSLFFPPSQSH